MRSRVVQIFLTLVVAIGWLAGGSSLAIAQTATGSIRGFVTDSSGAPLASATVVARDAQSGTQRSTVSRDNGFYSLNGLNPGRYLLSARRIGSTPQERPVNVGVGQVLSIDLKLGQVATTLGGVTVVAASAVPETRTSETATNVSPEQINQLPTPSRNFLDLVTLAPGTRITPDRVNGTAKVFAAGAQPAEQINVFIDGASYKNDIVLGGVAGQDASRGNPFPRNAVQEFRIVTNNFKAEYQKASSAIITAVTKSGTNTWQGSAFTELQNKSLVALDTFQRRANLKKQDYERYLLGLNLGGPIIQNKLFFFGSYEGNYQDRTALTVLGGTVANYPPAIQALNNTSRTSPFREHLGFGKLTFVPDERQRVDFEGDIRKETDTRGFGGQNGDTWRPYSSAENHRNNVYTGRVRHTYGSANWINEAMVSYQHYLFNEDPIDFTTPIVLSPGNYWLGGRDSFQDLTQNRLTLRDDWTYTGLRAAGDHVIKLGASFDNAKYDMNKQLNENPKFFFDQNNSVFPYKAEIGFGNPDVQQTNNQFGVYGQDDWSPTRRLLINVGVRWDIETGMFNRDYVTPTAVADSLRAYQSLVAVPFDAERYISDGSNRSMYTGAVQPRIGVSYALDDAGKTTVFGAFGIFTDRLPFNATLDETYRRQHPNYTINFVAPGTPNVPAGQFAWDPSYQSRTGLLTLISQVSPPQQLFLIPNDLKPPHSNQWSAGVKHDFGGFDATLAYNGTRSFNGFSFEWANLRLDPAKDDCCIGAGIPAYQDVLVGNNTVHTWYDALLAQINRQYHVNQKGYGWGAGLAYTLSKAEAEGGDLFSFPSVRGGLNERHPIGDDRRHQFVFNWITDVPAAWGIQFSGLAQLSSGTPIRQQAFVPLPNPPGGNQRITRGFDRTPWFKNVDLRFRKNFLNVGGNQMGVTGSVFNVLNTQNLGCFNDVLEDPGPTPGTTVPNPNFGLANCVISDPRRFQIGVSYDFAARTR